MDQHISFFELHKLSANQRAGLLQRTESDLANYLAAVQPIIAAVKSSGDAALVRFAREFDGADINANELKATAADFELAFASLESQVISAIEYGIANIRRFHEKQKPEPMWLEEIRPGAFAGEKWLPIASAALYIPRGKGAFPSMVMMSAVPAVVAQVPELIIVTPPGADGGFDAATLVAARIAGIENVYKCGGAQAVAAVAYGTETIPRVKKILGPGSPYVIAAKRLLSDILDPGIPAGPSESIVLADATANASIAALDLIIEAEHGDDSSAFLVTPSRELAAAAREAIPFYWQHMGEERVNYCSAVLGGRQGGIILTPDMQSALQFVNDYAPEHLQILSNDPFMYLGDINNAGEILLGENSPSVIANYLLGPNAILPTGGAAATMSPLSVYDFMKRTSVGYVTAKAYPELAYHTHVLATYEGFDGHANAVSELRQQACKKAIN